LSVRGNTRRTLSQGCPHRHGCQEPPGIPGLRGPPNQICSREPPGIPGLRGPPNQMCSGSLQESPVSWDLPGRSKSWESRADSSGDPRAWRLQENGVPGLNPGMESVGTSVKTLMRGELPRQDQMRGGSGRSVQTPKIMTATHKMMTATHKIMTATHKIMTATQKIMTATIQKPFVSSVGGIAGA